MTNYILLLPPSEGKTKGGNEEITYRQVENSEQYNFFLSLQFDRQEVYNKLRKSINELDEHSLEKLFGVKEKNLKESYESILDMLNSPTLPSIERFSGVMFKAIHYFSLDLAEQERFNESTLFIDGMFGLIKPQDFLPEYKLKISSKFLDINLTKFWKERLKGEFDSLFRNKLVIDILPEAHRKVVSKNENTQYLEISFVDLKNGKYKQAGHNSKELKGEFVRYLVSFTTISRKELEIFSHSSGYSYSSELSTKHKVVYLKSHN